MDGWMDGLVEVAGGGLIALIAEGSGRNGVSDKESHCSITILRIDHKNIQLKLLVNLLYCSSYTDQRGLIRRVCTLYHSNTSLEIQ